MSEIPAYNLITVIYIFPHQTNKSLILIEKDSDHHLISRRFVNNLISHLAFKKTNPVVAPLVFFLCGNVAV